MNKNALSIAPITAGVAGRVINAAARTAKLVEGRTEEKSISFANWAHEPREDVLAIAARLMMNLKTGERVIAVAGISDEDPSGLFSLNLALAMEQVAHGPVLLIEGDPNSKQICAVSGISEGPGLCEVLESNLDPETAVRSTAVPNLFIMPMGQPQARGRRLTPDALRGRFESLERFHYVLVHIGQIVNRPDAMLLASASHGLIAAIAPEAHTQGELRRFKKEVARMRSRFLGISLVEQA